MNALVTAPILPEDDEPEAAPVVPILALPDATSTPLEDPLSYSTLDDIPFIERTGTPGVYTPRIAAAILRFMAAGYSFYASAGKLGFSPELIYQWANENPSFAEVLQIARGARLFYLESRALHPKVSGASANILLRAMSRVAPEEWGEKVEIQTNDSATLKLVEVFESIVVSTLNARATQRIESHAVEIDESGAIVGKSDEQSRVLLPLSSPIANEKAR